MVLSHLQQNDEVGQMLNISHDPLQLQASVPWPVMGATLAHNSGNMWIHVTSLTCGIS